MPIKLVQPSLLLTLHFDTTTALFPLFFICLDTLLCVFIIGSWGSYAYTHAVLCTIQKQKTKKPWEELH
jgi:hypothetical protein